MSFQVGRFYLVPTVRGKYCGITADWPVIGDFHEDAEHIRFPHWHYHVDARFIPVRLFRRVGKYSWTRDPHHAVRAYPLMIHEDTDGRRNVRFEKGQHPKPVRRLLRCARQYADMGSTPPWQQSLEAAYSSSHLKKGYCPHRGADLSTLPVDRAGCIECPLHGPVFEHATGALVPRQEWRQRLLLQDDLEDQRASPCA